MTVKDILDQIVFDSDDDDGKFRTAALRWFNLVRAYIAQKGEWRSAMVADATLTTAAATTDGLYILDGYEHLVHDWMWDETNENVIRHESYDVLNALDVDKSTTDFPAWWADAGVDTNGAKQIYIWPVPDGAYTIRYAGYKLLTDLVSTDENLSTDPFFGPINRWGPTFTAGLRYYYDMNNHEDANIAMAQKQIFDMMIRQRRSEERIARTSGLRLKNVRGGTPTPMGRFDPSRYPC